MPDLIDDFGDASGDQPRQKFLARVAHWCPWAIGIGGPLLIVDALITWAPLQWAVLVIALLWVFVMITSDVHQSLARICLRCMQEVPADAPVRAAKRRYQIAFREAHRAAFIGTWRRPGYTIICATLIAITSFIDGTRYPWVHLPIRVFVIWSVSCGWVHHRYKPWCPWCKWDEGGEAETVPDPVPDPSGTKVA